MQKRPLIIFFFLSLFILAGFAPSDDIFTFCNTDERFVVDVPILMYHHLSLDNNEDSVTVVSQDKFMEQMTVLKENGYTTVLFSDLIDFIENGKPLPAKPLLITFDDGYLSNLTLGAPVLKKLDMCATIFVIGSSIGKDTYKDTGVPIIPHFSLEQFFEFNCDKTFDLQSHSYDMHHSPSLEGADFREGVLRKNNESIIDYINNLSADFRLSRREIEKHTKTSVNIFSYPYGKYSGLAEQILQNNGVKATVTTTEGINKIRRNDPSCLFNMKRINVVGSCSGDGLIKRLEGYYK